MRVNRNCSVARRACLESLESRTLLAGDFGSLDVVAGDWTWIGSGGSGAATFDNAGGYAGALTNTVAGPAAALNGGYTLSPTGQVTLNDPAGLAGAMTGVYDVMAAGEGGASDSLAILTRRGTGFTDADLVGTFTLFANGSATATTGNGRIKFDGAGSIVSGNVRDRNRNTPIKTGSYSVADDGTVSATIVYGSGANTTSVTYTGSLSLGEDLLTLSPDTLDAAETRMLVAVKAGGVYGPGNFGDTWTVAGDGVEGSITTDGRGLIRGGAIVDADGTARTVSGSYTVNSAGVLTLNLRLEAGADIDRVTLTGAINASQNVATVQARPGAGSENSTLVLINSANHPPTLSQIRPIGTATANLIFEFTFAELLAASDAADVDGDPVSFVIDRVPANSVVTVNNLPAGAGTFINPGDTVQWTGPVQRAGIRTAFIVKAYDGGDASATPVAVRVKTILKGSVGVIASRSLARESAGAAGYGEFTFSRLLGDYTKDMVVYFNTTGDLADVTASVNGVALDLTLGRITIPANQRSVKLTITPVADAVAEAPEKLKITLTHDPLFPDTVDPIDRSHQEYLINPFKDDATITIRD